MKVQRYVIFYSKINSSFSAGSDRIRQIQLNSPFAIGSIMDQSVSFGTKVLTIMIVYPRQIGGTEIKDIYKKSSDS